MQEEMIEDAFELTEEDLKEIEQEDVDKEKDAEEEIEEEQPKDKEVPSGYMSKEAWIAAGKDPDEWVTPEVFKERRHRIEETSRLKRELKREREDFENRLKNVNLLAEKQLERQRKELLATRDEAIDTADKATVKRIDKELEDIDDELELIKEKEQQQQQKPAEVLEWEEENAWCMDPTDPRLPVARETYVKAINSGKTIAGALRAVDKAVAAVSLDKETKQTKKPPVPMVDSSNSFTAGKDTGSLSWNQLTHEEKTYYSEFFETTGMSKKEFLQTVADQRKGA